MLTGINSEIIRPMRECYPDYEAMVKKVNKELTLNVDLQKALFNYIGMSSSNNPKVAEMVGDLVLEEKRLNVRLNEIIEAQEKDK